MAFHRNNNGSNNRYNNNRQNFRPRHNNHQQQGSSQNGQRRHVNRINHVFESNGPDGRVRGTAQQLVEKYAGLARDAHASGDRVLMFNYYQHAEHYQRLYNEIMEENGQFEREREAQRAQYQSQPNMDGDGNFAPDNNGYGSDQPQQQGQQQQAPMNHGDQQGQGSYDQQPPAQQPTSRAPEPSSETGTNSTGGRVMGRRPAAPRPENAGSGQIQDDHMPSFLKKDIPIKQAAPPKKPSGTKADKADPASDDAEPAAAAFGKRRTPVRRNTTTTGGADVT